jgi:hypothetical protein
MTPVEIERVLIGPQPLDDDACLRQAFHPIGDARLDQPEGPRLRPETPAGPEPENEPAIGDRVSGRRYFGENRRQTNEIVGDQQAEREPLRLTGQRGQECPTLHHGDGHVAAHWLQMVPQPGMLDLGRGIGLLPKPQNLLVRHSDRSGLDPEADRAVHSHIWPPWTGAQLPHFSSMLAIWPPPDQ